jgi:nanoRNase/pAp phosphatase (c-di-AMP/oligoRNAs hydrolase)
MHPKIKNIINILRKGDNLILLHHNADGDAVGSAIALKTAFPKNDIGASESISRLGKYLLSELNETATTKTDVRKYKRVIAVDASTPEQIGNLTKDAEETIVIDHHSRNGAWNAKTYLCDEGKTSCAELVYQILKAAKVRINKKIGISLLVGIITDTGQFSRANKGTHITTAEILKESGIDIEDVFKLIKEGEQQTDNSQKIALLKGAQRMNFEIINGFILASSYVSSYESAVSKMLTVMGADVSVVGGEKNGYVRVSTRATPEAVKRGVHLGKILSDIGKTIKCDGGGHAGAAGLNGYGDLETIMGACMKTMRNKLKKLHNEK